MDTKDERLIEHFHQHVREWMRGTLRASFEELVRQVGGLDDSEVNLLFDEEPPRTELRFSYSDGRRFSLSAFPVPGSDQSVVVARTDEAYNEADELEKARFGPAVLQESDFDKDGTLRALRSVIKGRHSE